MPEGVPLVVFFSVVVPVLVLGAVVVTLIYYRSREKQLMIEKGIPPEQMLEMLKSKRSPYTLMKIGIIIFFFGFGLGFGILMAETTGDDPWGFFLTFTFTGLGFVAASLIAKKLEDRDKEKERQLNS
ncbi:MAG: DUF6249 domain-containing protein [Melioribacteraceae bacterium]|nr:DUF6249 domain-containing protein [Melioribacteraceae bacterium]MCF8356374.1 DUF6249 domain-containing protein [Melioribacteraceae bacterium]MCF8395757.1 DUF6249 domain-containing protein [Melioribacteraceae bacterium]MCF8420900.1 DUF6249 domain-containing protein [Melioribacteraceae bacterium]